MVRHLVLVVLVSIASTVILYRTGGDAHSPLCTAAILASKTVGSLPVNFREMACETPHVTGNAGKCYESVKKAFLESFEKGHEDKAQVAVYVKGEKVVDLAGSQGDEAYGVDSLQIVFSNSKSLEAVVVAFLVDQGHLDYNERVSTYWPEFSQGHKENVTVADVMRHEAGLCAMDESIPRKAWSGNMESMESFIASQPYRLFRNSTRCYHGVTRGFILNPIVRRVDPNGRTIGQIIQDNIVAPFLLQNDLFSPIPRDSKAHKRRFQVYRPSMMRTLSTKALSLALTKLGLASFPRGETFFVEEQLKGMESILMKTIRMEGLMEGFDDPETFQTPDTLQYEMPSVNVVANAGAMARVFSAMSRGGVDESGHRIMSESAVATAVSEGVKRLDAALGFPTMMTKGGFGVNPSPVKDSKGPWYGWTGWGGSVVAFNPTRQMAFAYLMTRQGLEMPNPRSARLLEASIAAADACASA